MVIPFWKSIVAPKLYLRIAFKWYFDIHNSNLEIIFLAIKAQVAINEILWLFFDQNVNFKRK